MSLLLESASTSDAIVLLVCLSPTRNLPFFHATLSFQTNPLPHRLDESDFRAWNAIKTKKSWHDPPLTDLGKSSAFG